MRVVVVGAGVIGSVYAARLAAAGHGVHVLAHGRRRAALGEDGLRVRTEGRVLTQDVDVLPSDGPLPEVDVIIVAVRATQLDPVLDVFDVSTRATVVFLQHLAARAREVVTRLGVERTVLAFPGIGGLVGDDGVVEYVEIGAQPTTIDATAVRAATVGQLIASTGMRTAMEDDMPAWFATHEVFVACMGAGILACGGDAATLARDQVMLRRVVAAVHEGFAALSSHGVAVTPSALRVLFSTMPGWFAAAYWRHALQGPVGTIALAPHSRASRDDEFPLLCAGVVDRFASSETPTLSALLEPHARMG